MKIAGVVLAGGQGRRMGGVDKAMIELDGRPLMAHVLERFAPQVETVAINANGDNTRFAAFDAPVLADDEEDFAGPLAGVLVAMRWAKSQGCTHVLTAAADTPFFPDALCEMMKAQVNAPDTIVMAVGSGRIHPVFALWPVHLADALYAYLRVENMRKILTFAERYSLVEVNFDGVAEDPFFNINTPDDLALAEQRLENANG